LQCYYSCRKDESFAKKLFRFLRLLKTNKLFKTPLGRFGGPFLWGGGSCETAMLVSPPRFDASPISRRSLNGDGEEFLTIRLYGPHP
jgi:hypothetical protein